MRFREVIKTKNGTYVAGRHVVTVWAVEGGLYQLLGEAIPCGDGTYNSRKLGTATFEDIFDVSPSP